MERLVCNKLGDGALHFNYVERGKVIDRQPTLADVQDYLDNHPDAILLKEQHWIATVLNGKPILRANISRIDEKTLSVDGKPYFYEIDDDSLFWKDRRHVLDHCLVVKTEWKGEIVKVRNYEIRASVRHFLNNERQINEVSVPKK